MRTVALYSYCVSLMPSLQAPFTIFRKKSPFTLFMMMIDHLSSSLVTNEVSTTFFSHGREKVALHGFTAIDQKGSVPFAIYELPIGTWVETTISVDIPSGTLGYGLTATSFLAHQVQPEMSISDESIIICTCIEISLGYISIHHISFFSKVNYFVLMWNTVSSPKVLSTERDHS